MWLVLHVGLMLWVCCNLYISVQVSSSSAAERNWCTYDFIHSKKRNRLTEARARDLVYVHSNSRLLKHIEAVDYTETTVQWEELAVNDSESEEDDQDEN